MHSLDDNEYSYICKLDGYAMRNYLENLFFDFRFMKYNCEYYQNTLCKCCKCKLQALEQN